jgi:hypothetical protein
MAVDEGEGPASELAAENGADRRLKYERSLEGGVEHAAHPLRDVDSVVAFLEVEVRIGSRPGGIFEEPL